MRTYSFNIQPHEDIELGYLRNELDYYVTLPNEGINSETGLILSIPGFGGIANSEYYLEKLNPYLADKYNCIVVSLNYFGIFRGLEINLDEHFVINMEKVYGVSREYWNEISSKNDFYLKVVQILESKGLNSLDPRCQALMVTAREEYQSFGFLPAIDCLTVLGDVLKKYPNINTRKIIAYGSSYGGYIAMLCGKYAPNTFSVVIDNSGFSLAEMKNIVGREIFANDYVANINWNNKNYSIPFAYNNPWTILDETSPRYFGDANKLIRSLLVSEHRVKSDTRYYIFHCEEDEIASVDDKDRLVALLSNYNYTYYKRITKDDIDGNLFKKYGHAMDASLRKLFDHVVELDKENGLLKEKRTNDFLDNEGKSFNCGSKNYVFNFNENFTINAKIINNIKTDYKLISSFQVMSGILDITHTMNDGFDYVISKISTGKYHEAIGVMQDILDAYSAIEQQVNKFEKNLPQNNIKTLNEELKTSLLEMIGYFESDSWKLVEDKLLKHVVPQFMLWKNELNDIFSLYIAS
ncbi:DUF2920 family protein [Bacillus sp. RG28]|uniref:DUF2920 family protein n=1 Tax=Gottfriedia endophytica TaxID=2820819 RepID=A0A940NLM2_9BACI|nr:DUF2920 family protein [Gottfriedia endophytica]MBP0726730.1 DUF2920 family protein [Gottfriedia endophytica]